MGLRKHYSDEFKRETAKLATQSGNSIASVADGLGVHRSVVSRWVQEGWAASAEVPAVTGPKDVNSEVEQLRRELAKVRIERDILKKALGYFAKDPM
jgi:transposase